MRRVLLCSLVFVLWQTAFAQDRRDEGGKSSTPKVSKEFRSRDSARLDTLQSLIKDLGAVRLAELSSADYWWGATYAGDLNEFRCTVVNLSYWYSALQSCDLAIVTIALKYNLFVMKQGAETLGMLPSQDKVSEPMKSIMLRCQLLARHWVEDACAELPSMCEP